jgi:hypothetical protein
MPIVGSFAGASARAYGLGAGGIQIGDFESIATITAGSAVPSIEFTSIPQTYTHLQIRGIARNSTSTSNVRMQFNSDTAANYSWHELYGDGSSTGVGAGTSVSFIYLGSQIATADSFSPQIIDILDYANTNKYKTTRNLNGYENNSAGLSGFNSGNWRSNSAITSIKIYPAANNFTQYSTFALYGVKA